jgi:hypothetical protein
MKTLLSFFIACGALVSAVGSSMAAPAVGCEGFLWPLATEIAWMKSDTSENAASGATLPTPPEGKAIALALKPAAEVKLPAEPTKTVKAEDGATHAGIISFGNIPEGHYQVTLSVMAWIDVVQNGKALEATGHTGSSDCEFARKSVRFEITNGPATIQIYGAKAETVKFTIRPAAD